MHSMRMLDSGIVRPRAWSRSTGIFAMGQTARNAAADASSPKSTRCGVKGVSFS
jgi:hypothetical protein